MVPSPWRNPVLWILVVVNIGFAVWGFIGPTSWVGWVWIFGVLPLSGLVWVFWVRRRLPCPRCGAPMKRRATVCPTCGFDQKPDPTFGEIPRPYF